MPLPVIAAGIAAARIALKTSAGRAVARKAAAKIKIPKAVREKIAKSKLPYSVKKKLATTARVQSGKTGGKPLTKAQQSDTVSFAKTAKVKKQQDVIKAKYASQGKTKVRNMLAKSRKSRQAEFRAKAKREGYTTRKSRAYDAGTSPIGKRAAARRAAKK